MNQNLSYKYISFHNLDSICYFEGNNIISISNQSTQKIKLPLLFSYMSVQNLVYLTPLIVSSTERSEKKINLFYFYLKNLFKSSRTGYLNGIRILGRGYKIFKSINNYSMRLGFCHQINYVIPFFFKAKNKPKLKNFWLIKGFNKNTLSNLIHFLQTFKVPNSYRYKGVYTFDQMYKKKPVKKSL